MYAQLVKPNAQKSKSIDSAITQRKNLVRQKNETTRHIHKTAVQCRGAHSNTFRLVVNGVA